MSNLTVSVIIPVYNSEKTIKKVLDSVKNQTFFNYILEIIVVNDGSTDNSETIIEKYCLENSNMPIRYYFQENKGVSSARNKGIKMAKAEWIALLDSDDIWHRDKLEKQLKEVQKNSDIVFLGTGHLNKPFIRKGKKITSLYKADLFDIFWSFFPVTPSVLFKRDAVKVVGYFDENQKYCEDINYYIRFAIYFNYYYLPQKLVDIDIGKQYHGESGLTSNLKGMHEGEMKNLRELYNNKTVSIFFYIFFYIFLTLKFWRRVLIFYMNRKKYGV